MKHFLIIVFLGLLSISCNNNTKKEKSEDPSSTTFDFDIEKSEEENVVHPIENRSQGLISEENSASMEKVEEKINHDPNITGQYKKVVSGEENTSCNCYCIELSFSSNFDLCIAPDKIYISARAVKMGDGSADIYLVETVKAQNLEREIPWNKFDRNTPIARVEYQPNGSLELDWIGFP